MGIGFEETSSTYAYAPIVSMRRKKMLIKPGNENFILMAL